jgi:DNA primase
VFYDFEEIKARVSLADAAQMLGLQLKKNGAQQRGPCPVCKGQERGLVLTEGKGWYCFSAKTGGDVIALVAHIKACKPKEAAEFLSGTEAQATVPTVPQKEASSGETKGGMTALAYLESSHEAVLALGFDPTVAARLGIGYAPKGLMRGSVAVPIRDEHGAIQGYIGLEDPVKLPPDFTTNVISFDKKRA